MSDCAKCGHPRAEHSINGACYGLCGEFAAAPQATDPRDEKIESLTEQNKRLWKDCANLGLAATLNSDRADAAESRIATLTAERDAAWRVLEKIAEYDWVPAYAIQALYHVQGLARAALTTQPSKTETRDEG